MEWNDIITALVSLVSGGVISTFATLGLTRKKTKADISLAEANATNAANNANKTTFETLSNTIDSLDKHLDNEQADNEVLRTQVKALQEENLSLKNENFCKGNLICLHIGCKGRRPPYGTGNVYLKDKLESGEIDTDTKSIEEIMAEIDV